MYFDALTAAAVADESREMCGGRVQQVVQISELELGFEIYAGRQRHYLFASAHPRHSRVHWCSEKLRRGVEQPSQLLLLLRKYVRGGRIAAVQNPEFERIVRFTIEGVEGRCTLVFEPMGRHANIILVDAGGMVMDAIKRVDAQMSRVRPILPHRPYTPPPPQDKLVPNDLTEWRLRTILDRADPAQLAWRVLVQGVAGVSPLLAREIVYRGVGRVPAQVQEMERISPLLDAFVDLTSCIWEHKWQPCVALQEGQVVAFAPYLLTHYAEREPVQTVSAAMERYDEVASGPGADVSDDAYAPAKERVYALLDDARRRVQTRRRALKGQLASEQALQDLRLSGEMILAYAHAIEPGQEALEAQVDWENSSTQPPMRIALDPQLTPVENAQAYFTRYEKAKSAAKDVPRLLARANMELAYLDQLVTDLDLASNWPEIDEVKEALIEAGYVSKKRKLQRGQPLRVVSEEGFLILVGRSARQNDQVTFRHSSPDDLWLHAVDVPGAHVIVKCEGRSVPEKTLRRAAGLAAYYSAQRGENRVVVAYTKRRYVRRIKGARPGLVTYTHHETVAVSPQR